MKSKRKSNHTVWDFDCAVIGGGPGGLVSAMYLGRFERSVALINAGKPRAAWIPKTHNLLGFPYGIPGEDLLKRLNRHAAGVGVEKIRAHAEIERHGEGFLVHCIAQGGRSPILAKKVIVATGIQDVEPAIDNIEPLRKKGYLRYCSICDGYDFRGHVYSVLAQDDAGVQKALFVRRFAKRMNLFIPADLNLAPQRIIELRSQNVRVYRGTIDFIEEAKSPKGIWIKLKGQRPVFSRIAYVSMGCQVNDQAFSSFNKINKTKAGFLIVTTEQRTSVKGLFAVGDCVNQVGQISIAAGQAAVAATTIHNDLMEDEF